MSPILTVATICVGGFALLWCGLMIELLWRIIVKKHNPTFWDTITFLDTKQIPEPSRKIKWSLAILLALALFLYDSNTFQELVGIQTLEGKNKGTYSYCVEVEQNGNKYTLPGEISIDVDVEEGINGRADSTRYYYINKVYFTNGGYLDFEDGDNRVTDLSDSISMTDQDGKLWTCRIIDEHAYCPQIEETSYVSTWAVFELVGTVAVVIYNWMGYLCWDEKAMKGIEDTGK